MKAVRILARAILLLSVGSGSAALFACTPHAHEGKPYDLPNYAPAQGYLDSISREGESYRVFGCIAQLNLVQYVIIFPSDQKKGLLLIYVAGPFIPRVKSAEADRVSKMWRLRELPNTDWSLQQLPAARYLKYVTNDEVVQNEFNKIMSSHPEFHDMRKVRIKSLYSMFAKNPWLTSQCPGWSDAL